ACYKEEIEANLRTPGLSGFQLLDLHDYVGQGSAFVGLLDTFWEEKGYAKPEEFKEFCGTIVPLARLTKRVFTAGEEFSPDVEVANFDRNPLTNAVASWEVLNSADKIMATGVWSNATIPIGKNISLGKVNADLSKLAAPAAYRLAVKVEQASSLSPSRRDARSTLNSWNFWLYPQTISSKVPQNIFITTSWDEAETNLAAGKKVLFQPRS